MKYIDEKLAKKLMPRRKLASHKGENGRVAIFGGSKQFYGAPILAAYAAKKSGSDLVYLAIPRCHYDMARGFYPDLIVESLHSDDLQIRDLKNVEILSKKCDCLLLGPGISEKSNVKKCIKKLIMDTALPLVLDAGAIQAASEISNFNKKRQIVITPHLNELRRLTNKDVKDNIAARINAAKTVSEKSGLIVLLKGRIDVIAGKGKISLNRSGNAGMTAGGTGDVLSGIVASLIAQGVKPFDAAVLAAYLNGRAGDILYKERGFFYTASDVAEALPLVLKRI